MNRADVRLRLIEIVCGRNPHLKEAVHILEIARELEPFVIEVLDGPVQPPAPASTPIKTKTK